MSIKFRIAQPSDGQTVINLLKMLEQESDSFDVDTNLDEISGEFESRQIELINQTRTNLIAVATDEDKLIGLATVDQVSDNVGELGIAVLAHYHNQKVGSNLVELVLKWANETSVLKSLWLEVYKNNDNAVHLYSKFGFEIIDNHDGMFEMEKTI